MIRHLYRISIITTLTLVAASCNTQQPSITEQEVSVEQKDVVSDNTVNTEIPTTTAPIEMTLPPPALTIDAPTVIPIVTKHTATHTKEPTIINTITATPEPMVGPEAYPTNVNPLTGQTVPDPALLERRPLAIKISNYPRYVRPQSGLDMADMVWEHYAEGGTSRYTAIYYIGAADRIGPIRSARLIDLTLVDMLDSALVASGTSQGTLDRLWKKPWYAAVVTRANGFKCPPLCQEGVDANTVFASAAAVWHALDERGQNTKPAIQGLAFHSVIPDGGQDGTKLRVDFSAEAHSEWRYNSSSKHYERWIDASATELEEHIDDYTGGQIVADNLSVLFANHIVDFTIPEDFDADGIHATFATEIQLWGSGPALLLRDGQAFACTWQRDDASKMPTLMDNDGKPLPLRPGKTWVYTTHIRSYMEQSGSDWIIGHRSPKDRGELILPTTTNAP